MNITNSVENGQGVPPSADNYSVSQNDLGDTSISPDINIALMGFRGGFGAINGGFQMMLGGTNQILKLNEQQTRTLRYISATMGIIFAGLMLYTTISNLRKQDTLKQTALAISETIAYAAAQQWQNIAMATGAAVSIGAAFGAGHYVGRITTQSKNVESVGSITSPEERRAIIARMEAERDGY